jgi:hypothetical protein
VISVHSLSLILFGLRFRLLKRGRVYTGARECPIRGEDFALHYMHCNFCRVHKRLRVTPAMEAALTDHIRTLEEVAQLLEATNM